MPIETTYAAIASMDVPAEKEDLFNEIYDEHVTFLLEVPGVRAVTRMKGEPFEISIAGEIKSMPAPDPVYTAIYELDTPEVMQTAEWASAKSSTSLDDKIVTEIRTKLEADGKL